jgi:hypothetical protein
MNCDICKTLCLRPEEHGLCGLWLPGWFVAHNEQAPNDDPLFVWKCARVG